MLAHPLLYRITAGNSNDWVTGYEILDTLDLEDKQVIADRGYDTDRILTLLKENKRIQSSLAASAVPFNARLIGSCLKNVTWWKICLTS